MHLALVTALLLVHRQQKTLKNNGIKSTLILRRVWKKKRRGTKLLKRGIIPKPLRTTLKLSKGTPMMLKSIAIEQPVTPNWLNFILVLRYTFTICDSVYFLFIAFFLQDCEECIRLDPTFGRFYRSTKLLLQFFYVLHILSQLKAI